MKEQTEHTQKTGRAVWTCLTILWMLFIFFMSAAEKDDSSAQSGAICEWICETFVQDYEDMSPARQLELQDRISFPVRKGAHLTEYMVLGALLTRTAALWLEKEKNNSLQKPQPSASAAAGILTSPASIALAAGFLYAVSDEIHQVFVAGRAGQPGDVLIDTVGVLLGILLSTRIQSALSDTG